MKLTKNIFKENNTPFGEPIHEPSTSASTSQLNSRPTEDTVDVLLSKIDGRIQRGRDEKL